MAYSETGDEVKDLEEEIKSYEDAIARKKAYLDFLKANPLFQEYQRLKAGA